MFEYPDNSIPTTPSNFLALPPGQSDIETSGIVILPVPYDSTTSFRTGSREGPRAIIEASAALEDYDLEMDLDVAELGIYTAPVLEPHLGSPELNVERVKQAVSRFLAPNKMVGVIGGEHSITAGSVLAHKAVYPDLSVLYLDAHCDLRDEYMGTRWGHASGGRRIHDLCSVVFVGLRSMCEEERDYIQLASSDDGYNPISTFVCPIADSQSLARDVIEKLNDAVYVSVDLDVFDPSLMPSVGTPEPGGMDWYQVVGLIKAVSEKRRIVGFDVCELAPREGPSACSYTAAKLVYKLIAYSMGS